MKSISPQKAKRTLDYLERRKQGFEHKYEQYYTEKKKLEKEITVLLNNLVVNTCPECGEVTINSLRYYYSDGVDISENVLCHCCQYERRKNDIRKWFAEITGTLIDKVKVENIDDYNGYVIMIIHGNKLRIHLSDYIKAKK
jgi:hypothetical protein